MPQFAFTVKNREGIASSGMIEAADKEAAVKALTEQELIITGISAVQPTTGLLNTLGLHRVRVKPEELISLTQSIGAMLEAGVTLKTVMSVLAVDANSPEVRQILVDVDTRLGQGESFSAALQRYPDVFSRLYLGMVEAGETSGKLPELMGRLGRYIEDAEELKGKVKGALTYPVVVFVFALLLVAGLCMFAVPRLNEVYRGLGVKLPAATQMVLGLGNLFVNFWFVWVPLLIFAILGARQYLKTENGRYQLDNAVLNMPVVGLLYRQLAIARFARSLGTLYGAGVPIVTCFELVGRTMDNSVLEKGMAAVSKDVLKGETIAQPLREAKFFTNLAVSMISAGEEAGSLARMLERLAMFYETQVSLTLKTVVALIEPLTMVGIGLLVGVLVLIISLPFLQISTVLH